MKNNIPKVIHYVWVGGKEKPKKIKQCIKTWKKVMPDYAIKEWNENNFDINSNDYIKAAYKNKKWAFVSDYIRMYALYNEGGIYFDTDVIAIRKLDEYLCYDCFTGFESNDYPFTAVIGAKKNHPLIKTILDNYDKVEKKFDMDSTNTKIVSNILIEKYGCKTGNKKQVLKNNILILPKELLCNPSLKSRTIHAFTASWDENMKVSIIGKFENRLRSKMTNKYIIIFYRLLDFLIFIPKRNISKYIKKKKRE